MEIKKLGRHELDRFQELIRVFEEVFEMKDFSMPRGAHLQKVLQEENFYVFVAISGDLVVGGLTAYRLSQYYSELPQVYIYDLGVKTAFQRRGIGRMLIAGLTGYCKDNGVEEVFVQADYDDLHAIEFYRATGGRPEQVVHFNYPLNSSGFEKLSEI